MQHPLFKLIRPEILALVPYRSARSLNVKGEIWLNANENPWDDTVFNRYPEPAPLLLQTLLAKTYNITPNELLITRGSDEGIDLLLRLFCRAGLDKIMICPPTYGMYRISANIQHAGVIEVPLLKSKDFSLDVSQIIEKWHPDIKLIFLCSPNNPTGNLLCIQDILALLENLAEKVFIIVDEAYIEFAENDGMISYLRRYPNLIILRTLSKAYGLAGIRCGMTLAHPEIIGMLKKIIAPYPIPSPIIDIILRTFSFSQLQKKIPIIRNEREKLKCFLETLSFIKKVWKSDANFLLFETEDSERILAHCFHKGIILRDRSFEFSLENCIRVTIGTQNENQYLMEVLKNA